PIAGMIISFVLCYELITMVTSSNNLQSFDTWVFFKFVFKAWVAVYLLSHTFDFTMASFDVAQHIVNRAAGVISHDTNIDIAATIATMQTTMETMELGDVSRIINLCADNVPVTKLKLSRLHFFALLTPNITIKNIDIFGITKYNIDRKFGFVK
ncbi:MAG: hypothetical protein IIX89_01335, partial [Oscillospiraceae bacterium]|nr:hypothetical protein [Oscillospiraceae bacterium]